MSIERKLNRYKTELEETQSKIDQEKGALSTTFDSLKELLQTKKTDEKILIQEAEKKIKALETENENLDDELENLMEEIEEDLE